MTIKKLYNQILVHTRQCKKMKFCICCFVFIFSHSCCFQPAFWNRFGMTWGCTVPLRICYVVVSFRVWTTKKNRRLLWNFGFSVPNWPRCSAERPTRPTSHKLTCQPKRDPLLIHVYSEGKSPQQPRWTNNRLPHWPKLCFLKAFSN